MSKLNKVVPCDLVELEMCDFDVILGMYWLYASYASVDCRTRRIDFLILKGPFSCMGGSKSRGQG